MKLLNLRTKARLVLPYACGAFAFFIFLIPTFSNILLAVLVMLWLLDSDFRQKASLIASQKILIAFSAFFILYLIGSTYTDDLEDAKGAVIMRLPLVLLPIVIGTFISPLTKPELRAILTTYIASAIICSLFLVYISIYQAQATDTDFFRYVLTAPDYEIVDLSRLKNHRPYLGLFVAFAIFLLTFEDTTYFKKSTTRLLIALFLLLSLFFLFKAKMSVVSVIILMVLRFYPKPIYAKAITSILLVIVAVILHDPIIDFVYNKIILSDGGSRFRNWATSIDAIKNSPIVGYGSGDELVALQMFRDPEAWEYIHTYNSHNQYLSILLQLGIIGMSVFAVVLFFLLYQSRKYYRPGIYFVLLFILAGFSEVLLSRNAGVLFFGFFSGLIISHIRYLSLSHTIKDT
ncbi:O-antigen ligase family protein [Pontibacter lucknowensis]|uniref:O-antigen ligase n=1 Tax=Pontibacter lucknowensis TaxID=1077936 RepID=A0A1N7ATQ5_9BACT|nr:O-antigen ligase family protein [Pontibacter lucknowensis]SIR42444.1 O-antigen ligase [Pontibacter lucknowensis]